MAEETVLKFMQDQNRPFNAQNVTDHMQKYGIKKPSVQKALDTLQEKELIVGIDNNKSRIYHASQAGMEVPSPEELKAQAAGMTTLQHEITQEQQAVMLLEREVNLLKQQQTPEEVEQKLKLLEAQCKDLESALAPLRTNTNVVSQDALLQRQKKFSDMFTLFRKRKRMFRNVWDVILESAEKKPSVLEDEVGIETDEAMGLDNVVLQTKFDKIKLPLSGRSAAGGGARKLPRLG